MRPRTPSTSLSSPSLRFVGDTETGIVHSSQTTCSMIASEAFLDLRTAIVRGYQICRCCERELALSPADSRIVSGLLHVS